MGEESETLTLTIQREAPALVDELKEMKKGLDNVRRRVQSLTAKVRENKFPTADGMSYLDAKHLLLLSYCQSIVYYLLRKAKGVPIDDHPVVHSLVEIRLFLEKIRRIDKKNEYQVQRLIRAASKVAHEKVAGADEQKDQAKDKDDPLKYRPNPDMLVSKTVLDAQDTSGVYRPPRFAPTTMDEDKMSKEEKQDLRKEKDMLRRSQTSSFSKYLIDDLEERPEEIKEIHGSESKEVARYIAKRERRDKEEEELFTRAPITKKEKLLEKHMKKSRNGLLGLSDDFYDEVGMLPLNEKEKDSEPRFASTRSRGKGFKKRKRKH